MGGARTKSVTLRLQLDVDKELDRYCAQTGLSKSLVTNSALSYFLSGSGAARERILRAYVKRAKRKS